MGEVRKGFGGIGDGGKQKDHRDMGFLHKPAKRRIKEIRARGNMQETP